MAGQGVDAVWSQEAELLAFRSIPPIDTTTARELLPDLVEVCELIAATQSLEWNSVCVCMATASTQLSPKDVLELCPSIESLGSLWTALLHPGSVNTSGLLKVYARAMEIVYDRIHMEECEEAKQAHKEKCDEIRRQERNAGRGTDEPKLPTLVLPPRRKGLAGGGSLSAAGFIAAMPQNRDSMTAIEPELEGILAWLLAEFAFDSAVPAKLWDGTTWDRPVMQQSKGFTMRHPFFSFCSGGHLYELLKRLQKDVIGLRQRLTVVYARPLFMDISSIRHACSKLPKEVKGKPAPFLAALLFPLLKLSLKKEAAKKISDSLSVCDTLGTIFYPSDGDGASTLIDEKFNARNEKQRNCYLQADHHLSKYHGKLKTKYDRMILGINNCNELAKHFLKMKSEGITMTDSAYVTKFSLDSTEVPVNVVKFCYLVADHCELTWAKLDLSRSMEELDVDETTLGGGGQQRHASVTQVLRDVGSGAVDDSADTIREHPLTSHKRRRVAQLDDFLKELQEKLSTTGSSLREDDYNLLMDFEAEKWEGFLRCVTRVPTLVHIHTSMRLFLSSSSAWVYYSDKAFRPLFQRACPDMPAFCALVAGFVLTHLGLGKVVLSKPTVGGGKRFWFFAKRPLSLIDNLATMASSDQQSDFEKTRTVLACLGYTNSSTPSLTAYVHSSVHEETRPAGAPLMVQWEWSQEVRSAFKVVFPLG